MCGCRSSRQWLVFSDFNGGSEVCELASRLQQIVVDDFDEFCWTAVSSSLAAVQVCGGHADITRSLMFDSYLRQLAITSQLYPHASQ